MPTFTSNSEGSISGTLKARFDSDTVEGSQQFKVRVRDTTSDINYDSNNVFINVTAVAPSPSPTVRPTVTSSSTPSPTPMASKTSSPSPIKTVSPKPVSTAQSPTPDILGLRSTLEETPIPTTEPNPDSRENVPVFGAIFIGVGVLTIAGAGYLAFKKQKADPLI